MVQKTRRDWYPDEGGEGVRIQTDHAGLLVCMFFFEILT